MGEEEPEQTDYDDFIAEFGRRARNFVAVGDRKGLKKLFVRLSIASRFRAGEDEQEAYEDMAKALRAAFLAPSKKVKRGRFDDLK